MLDASAPSGRVLAIDLDLDARARAEAIGSPRLTFVHGNFSELDRFARDRDFVPVDGVLLDLGLSSFQLDSEERGFAFRFDGPLDMRFDQSTGQTAADLVNLAPAEDLLQILWRFGEEQRARRIVQAIVAERGRAPIESTGKLAKIVSDAVGGRRGADTHPATKTFQALRIAVNRELEVLEGALQRAVDLLAPGGRLAVITFHSLEDRIVKTFMRREATECICPPEQPVCSCDHQARLRIIGKAIKPERSEVAANPRSRSALLRVGERLNERSEP
jgi:16S rRNA (cytosine1402-N4)-methyltransferase